MFHYLAKTEIVTLY